MANGNVARNVEPPKERIDTGTWKLMTAVAIGADLFQVMLGLFAPLISPFIFLTFWMWLKLHDVSIGDSIKRIAIMWGGFLVELIPVLNFLPTWTLSIFITVLMVRNKDKRKIKEFYKKVKNSTVNKK